MSRKPGVPGRRPDRLWRVASIIASGLIGKADVVEFHRSRYGTWLPFPVEYKRGKPKADDCDKVQLCAQAICLEEMLSVDDPGGGALLRPDPACASMYRFDEALRRGDRGDGRAGCINLIASGRTPPPVLREAVR